MGRVINFELLRNPYNWVIIFLMVAIASAAWTLLDPLQTQQSQGSPL